MNSEVSAVFHGVKELQLALEAQAARVDAATLAALKANQNLLKKNIRSRLRGRPRWDRRGKGRLTGPEVNLGLSSPQVSKSGGPGRLTGYLSAGVGSVKKPKLDATGTWVGGVGIGPGAYRFLYSRRLEAMYPYFAPALEKSLAAVRETWAKAWGKAMSR